MKVLVLNKGDLSLPIDINQDGDSIEIISYSHWEDSQNIRADYLTFGNNTHSNVGRPCCGYSIMRNYIEVFENDLTITCLTKSNSLGALNTLEGLSGTLKGSLVDESGNPVTMVMRGSMGYYLELHMPLEIFSDGTYSTKIFRKFEIQTINHVLVRTNDFQGFYDSIETIPFELNSVTPDTTIIRNIQLKKTSYTLSDVKDYNSNLPEDIVLINYPNPFNSSTNFFIKVPEEFKQKDGSLNIYNTNGELLKSIELKNNYSTLSWDGRDASGMTASTGIYYYKLLIDQRAVKNGSMILLK